MAIECPKCGENYNIEILYVNFTDLVTAYYCKICKYRFLVEDKFSGIGKVKDYK